MKKVITKKVVFSIYSLVLLSLGAFIQSNCGSATAQGTTAASEITFDNTGTGLSATNLQDAIAELENGYGPLNVQNALLGTWSGQQVYTSEVLGTFTITFNGDGTMSCATLTGSVSNCTNESYYLRGRNFLEIGPDTSATFTLSFEGPSSLSMYTDADRTLWVLTKSS